MLVGTPQFISDKQVPLWLQHPKSITIGVYLRHRSVWVTQLQIIVSQHQVDEPMEEIQVEKQEI